MEMGALLFPFQGAYSLIPHFLIVVTRPALSSFLRETQVPQDTLVLMLI